jgi:hypothetical protein
MSVIECAGEFWQRRKPKSQHSPRHPKANESGSVFATAVEKETASSHIYKAGLVVDALPGRRLGLVRSVGVSRDCAHTRPS